MPCTCPEVKPIGSIDVAVLLRVKDATVRMWNLRGVLPPPDWTVSKRPCWNEATIEQWARATDHWPAENDWR